MSPLLWRLFDMLDVFSREKESLRVRFFLLVPVVVMLYVEVLLPLMACARILVRLMLIDLACCDKLGVIRLAFSM